MLTTILVRIKWDNLLVAPPLPHIGGGEGGSRLVRLHHCCLNNFGHDCRSISGSKKNGKVIHSILFKIGTIMVWSQSPGGTSYNLGAGMWHPYRWVFSLKFSKHGYELSQNSIKTGGKLKNTRKYNFPSISHVPPFHPLVRSQRNQPPIVLLCKGDMENLLEFTETKSNRFEARFEASMNTPSLSKIYFCMWFLSSHMILFSFRLILK